MKKILGIIAALVLCAVTSQAQTSYDVATLIAAESVTIEDGATSNYTAVANVRKADTIAIMTTIQLEGAGTDGIIFKFAKTVDGSTFETTPSILITNAAAGTTATHYFNSVSTAGAQAIKLTSIVNGVSGQAITNIAVKVGIPTR